MNKSILILAVFATLAVSYFFAPGFWNGLFEQKEEGELLLINSEESVLTRKAFAQRKIGEEEEEEEEGLVQYAEGYGPEDFGPAFNPPEMPEELIEPGGIWKVLLKLRFDYKYDEALDEVLQVPLFTSEIESYDGKEIEVEGYIVPHDLARIDSKKSTMFMFSAVPAASCFFCGQAGPESIIEVYPKKPIPYSKEPVRIKGKLKLNKTDFLRMSYILEGAQIVY